MEYILLFIIILQFAYAVYKDVANQDERQDLQLKIMSKDIHDYLEALDEKEDYEEVESPYVPIEDVSADTILEAEDRT